MKRMMQIAACTALLSLDMGARAAQVNIEAYAIASESAFTPGSPLCTAGTSPGFDCERVISGRLGGNSDPSSYGADAAQHLEFYSNNVPAGAPPNFTYESGARASGGLGHLHAEAAVQVLGAGETPGATNHAPAAASARAQISISDAITVTSSTLPNGTPVMISTLLEVSGSGPGELTLLIANPGGGLNLKSIGTFSTPLADLAGTFQTTVGTRFNVTYSLMANMMQTTTAWRPIDILNGRANASNYGNSAHLFFGITDPGMDVQLVGTSGFDYVFPTTVPLPPAWLLLGSAVMLVRRARCRS